MPHIKRKWFGLDFCGALPSNKKIEHKLLLRMAYRRRPSKVKSESWENQGKTALTISQCYNYFKYKCQVTRKASGHTRQQWLHGEVHTHTIAQGSRRLCCMEYQCQNSSNLQDTDPLTPPETLHHKTWMREATKMINTAKAYEYYNIIITSYQLKHFKVGLCITDSLMDRDANDRPKHRTVYDVHKLTKRKLSSTDRHSKRHILTNCTYTGASVNVRKITVAEVAPLGKKNNFPCL